MTGALCLLLVVGADQDAVAVASQHPGRVLHRLAAGHLALGLVQIDGLAAQLKHAGLKAHAGPGGRLGKDHDEALTL